MKINNIDFDVDFTDADVLEKINEGQKIVEEQTGELLKIIDNLTPAEGIRQECKIAKNFLDYVLGDGTSQKLFGDKNSLDQCIKALEDVIKAKEEQENKVNSIISKYSPNRIAR